MEKPGFTLVFVAALGAIAGSAVTYAIMKRPAAPAVAVALQAPIDNPLPTAAAPAAPVVVEPPAEVSPALPPPAPVAKVKKSQLRASIAGTLSDPAEFEQNFFSSSPGVAQPQDLVAAVMSFSEQVAAIAGYLETHKGTQTRLAAARKTAKALSDAEVGGRLHDVGMLQVQLGADLADLARNAQNIAERTKETPESAAISAQVKVLAETIRKHASP